MLKHSLFADCVVFCLLDEKVGCDALVKHKSAHLCFSG